MKTDDLISLLATQTAADDRTPTGGRFGLAALLGLAGAFALMVLMLGVRPDLAVVSQTMMFWIRLAYPALIAAAALAVVVSLARPGVPVGPRWVALGLPPMAALAAMVIGLASAPEGTRIALWLGHTWKVCPLLIALLSTPAFAAMLWAVHGMAPVRLRLAGAATGLFAGAVATLVYCLHCPEMAPSFWAFWYLLGMLLPAAAGALMGPRALRW